MASEIELSERIQKLKDRIPENEWFYYHIGSVENFIYHLKSFKNERSKNKASDGLLEFITRAEEKSLEDSRLSEKLKELTPMIWDISSDYKLELGFIQKPDFFITSILFIGVYFILKLSLNNFYAIIIAMMIFLIYGFYCYTKIKTKKVY